jgi:hypothetical protein
MVPTYLAAGTRLRDYSVPAILALEKSGHVTVKRHPSGRIRSARFLLSAAQRVAPTRGTGLSRVRFTKLEPVAHWLRVFHKPLPFAVLSPDLEPDEKDLLVRASFAAVRRSALTRRKKAA